MPQTAKFKIAGGTLTFVIEPEASGYVLVTVRNGAFSVTARGDDMAFVLPIGFGVNVRIDYVDAHGNPANVDGEVVWSSSDDNIATVVADSADSQNALVRSSMDGTLGQAQITAKADADIGEGVRELVTFMDVEIVAGEAVAGVITPVGDLVPAPQPRR